MSFCPLDQEDLVINHLTEFLFLFILEWDFQEAIAIGRTFAGMKDYQLDGNKEMLALGTMNVVGSMTSCYVATGEKDARIDYSTLHFVDAQSYMI